MDAMKADEMAAQAALVSTKIREALQSSLPVSLDQLMTVQIPGVVIDTSETGPYFWNDKEEADTPHRVMVNEARLVDGMIPLSKIMMGPTGKSVARSYAGALDMLIPEDAPIDTNTTSPTKTAAAERYSAAMKYLTSPAPNSSLSVVDVYVQKQQAYTDAMSVWDQAKANAREESRKLAPNNVHEQQRHYDDWNQESFRNFKNHAQAKYMDWIVNGNKYKVDYYFGIVDVSSAMKRIESSKEASRNLVVIDPDGSTEWQTVRLTPANWAAICKEKVDKWDAENGKLSRKEYESEIKRLKRLLLSYTGLKESIGPAPATGDGTAPPPAAPAAPTADETALSTAYKDLYDAQAAKPVTEETAKNLKSKQEALQAALQAHGAANLEHNKATAETLANGSKAQKLSWLDDMIKDTQDQIDNLNKGLESYTKATVAVPAISEVAKSDPVEPGAEGVVVTKYSDAEDKWADPRFQIARKGVPVTIPAKQEPNKWTKISISVSTSKSESSKVAQSQSSSASASGSFGMFSASGGASYSKASAQAASSAANCNVDISFEALLVTIDRPWLHGELFSDQELNTSPDVSLSPGASAIHKYIESKDQTSLDKFPYFPSYPTSFIVAANVELEFRGDTTHLESAVESSSIEANVKVGYGPFSLSASHKQQKSSAKTKMETTATGTRITLEAPAIIGWVSTLLPALPRPKGGNSLAGVMI